VPPPDAAVVAAALAAVRAAAARETQGVAVAADVAVAAEIHEAAAIREAGEVREVGSVAGVGEVSGVGRSEAAALAGVTRTGEVPAPAQPPAPASARTRAARVLRTGDRRRWIVAAACVAALTAGLAALPTVGADGPPPAAANAASAFLGSVAAHARGSSVGANASLLTTVRERRPGFPETEFTVTIGHGQGVIRPAQGHDHGPARSPNFPYGPFLAPSFSWREVATLPSGTAELRDRLEALAPRQDLFGVIGGLLSISPVTPEVRAALYRVLATVPGVDLLGTGTDARGRAGTWLAHDDGTMRWKLLVDPHTGRLLQQDQVTLKAVPAAPCAKDRTPPVCPPALAAGDLVSRMTFLSQRVTG
jgi:hypothetical protein